MASVKLSNGMTAEDLAPPEPPKDAVPFSADETEELICHYVERISRARAEHKYGLEATLRLEAFKLWGSRVAVYDSTLN